MGTPFVVGVTRDVPAQKYHQWRAPSPIVVPNCLIMLHRAKSNRLKMLQYSQINRPFMYIGTADEAQDHERAP